MKEMIADYMEKGFLENIVDMFRRDNDLYAIIGDLIGDERSRVRIGAAALVETLMEEGMEHIVRAIPGIAEKLRDPNPTIRGDAAYVLGIIGHGDAVSFLEEAVSDENEMVRETVMEAIQEIKGHRG